MPVPDSPSGHWSTPGARDGHWNLQKKTGYAVNRGSGYAVNRMRYSVNLSTLDFGPERISAILLKSDVALKPLADMAAMSSALMCLM